MSKLSKFIAPYRVERGKGFRLKSIDPSSSGHLTSERKKDARDLLQDGVQRLCELQDKLYAQDRWAMLLVFQAMDAAGKDSAIKHVLSGINPQGCQVVSFKAPSSEDLDHDFMWRSLRALPERGRIGIFNRSYYEEVLIVRACPEILAAQKVPPPLVTKRIWDERYEDIRAIERYLGRNGVADSEVLPLRLEGRTAQTVPRAARSSGEELEVQPRRPRDPRQMEGLHGGLRGRDPRHRHRRGALVRRPRRPEMVHAAGRRRRGDRRASSRST